MFSLNSPSFEGPGRLGSAPTSFVGADGFLDTFGSCNGPFIRAGKSQCRFPPKCFLFPPAFALYRPWLKDKAVLLQWKGGGRARLTGGFVASLRRSGVVLE